MISRWRSRMLPPPAGNRFLPKVGQEPFVAVLAGIWRRFSVL